MTDNASEQSARFSAALLGNILVVAACAITYQLLIGTLSSYLLGNSVLHFSLTIGVFMFAMGIGAYVTRLLEQDLFDWFIATEITVALVGGSCALLLYLAYTAASEIYYVAHFAITLAVGSLVGMELPLVMRLLRETQPLRDAVAHAFSVDYLGALIASVLFPLVAVPYLGVVRTAIGVGLLNVIVAAFTLYMFRERVRRFRELRNGLLVVLLLLSLLGVYSLRLTGFLEQMLYQDPIVHSEQTPYQKLVLTENGQDLRLYIDGNLQFASGDEYRYHEVLVQVPMLMAGQPHEVLLLGGGDGLALREILRFPSVSHVTLVDLDPAMTRLGTQHQKLRDLNRDAFADERVRVVNQDAWQFVRSDEKRYDIVLIDLPDPNDFGVGKLYTREFYRLLSARLQPNALVATQATSPYFAREAYWCINATLAAVFPQVRAYQVYVPSFGQWGFHVAGNSVPLPQSTFRFLDGNRYLSATIMDSLFVFDADTAAVPVAVNTLDNQQLVQYYNNSWKNWHQQ